MNLLDVERTDGGFAIGGYAVPLTEEMAAAAAKVDGSTFGVGVRPEHLKFRLMAPASPARSVSSRPSALSRFCT